MAEVSKTGRINAKAAAQLAAKYYKEITGDQEKVNLEEVELSDDDFWYITLSHRESSQLFYSEKVIYKVFKINASTGEVISMKLRDK